MSRNRGSRSCECGWHHFKDRPIGHPGLMTFLQYLDTIGWPADSPYRLDSPGWGFDTRRNGGEEPYWRRKDGLSGGTISRWGDPEYNYQPWRYSTVSEEDRYRFGLDRCPICRRAFCVWYVLQPCVLQDEYHMNPEPPVYAAYDTSWWWAYSDEPIADDLIDVLWWTPEHASAAMLEYASRHPELRDPDPNDPYAKMYLLGGDS